MGTGKHIKRYLFPENPCEGAWRKAFLYYLSSTELISDYEEVLPFLLGGESGGGTFPVQV